jgi:hypothetical protein
VIDVREALAVISSICVLQVIFRSKFILRFLILLKKLMFRLFSVRVLV